MSATAVNETPTKKRIRGPNKPKVVPTIPPSKLSVYFQNQDKAHIARAIDAAIEVEAAAIFARRNAVLLLRGEPAERLKGLARTEATTVLMNAIGARFSKGDNKPLDPEDVFNTPIKVIAWAVAEVIGRAEGDITFDAKDYLG